MICKTVSDDEAQRLFLYLQKISREWSLLNQVTWDKYGSSAADATYGGYVIITFALMVGKLSSELPTTKRVSEYILLVIGIILYAVLGRFCNSKKRKLYFLNTFVRCKLT